MAYVFTMALGPVQDFIAAARRTRDFWFGSWMLFRGSACKAADKSWKFDNSRIFSAGNTATPLETLESSAAGRPDKKVPIQRSGIWTKFPSQTIARF